jgi:PKHD-type hydroxylase
MNSSVSFFANNSYVVLQEALDKKQCQELANYMFELHEKGITSKDAQCPLSDSIYGDPVFDKLLQDFAAPIGKSIGKSLLPTYTYARIYRTGEVLKRHVDRPACEISATLTLAYDSKPIWPIIIDKDKEIPIVLDVGELVVYKGCEKVHWRDEFKGKWHVQIFLHYVDANGPYVEEYKDGRMDFGTDKNIKTVKNPEKYQQSHFNSKPKLSINDIKNFSFIPPIKKGLMLPNRSGQFPGYFAIDKDTLPELMFTAEECEKILSVTKREYASSASIGTTESNLNKKIRSAKIYLLENNEEYEWLFEKVGAVVSIVNTIHFNYQIMGITHGLQLIEYDSSDPIPGHYTWHSDAGPGEAATRKISLTAQISDPQDYEGCELTINNIGETVVGTKQRGSIHLFPSFLLHQVSPITKGKRYALVIWVHGSEPFR